jgi:hypothetical protein
VIDLDDSVANPELIGEVYRRAGLSPRGQAGLVHAQLLRQTTAAQLFTRLRGSAGRY